MGVGDGGVCVGARVGAGVAVCVGAGAAVGAVVAVGACVGADVGAIVGAAVGIDVAIGVGVLSMTAVVGMLVAVFEASGSEVHAPNIAMVISKKTDALNSFISFSEAVVQRIVVYSIYCGQSKRKMVRYPSLVI